MIAYLLNFTLCSAVLLIAYHLLLKNKAMYGFNRFYLLAALVLSLIIPLVVINREVIPVPAAAILAPVQEQLANNFAITATNTLKPDTTTTVYSPYHINFYLLIYAAVSGLLMLRFGKNLYVIQSLVKNNVQHNFKGAKLVLIEKELTPHTFLNCIFLNKAEYQQQKVESGILNHDWHMPRKGILTT